MSVVLRSESDRRVHDVSASRPPGAALSPGKRRRLQRIGPGDGRFLFVPMDHSVSDGPIASVQHFRHLVAEVAAAGADAIVVHKGRAATIADVPLGRCALVVHLSASTSQALDPNAKVLVGTVEDAVRLGADAVSVHVNIGAPSEPAQLADLGTVAAACERFGLPLLAMMYARGPQTADPHDPAVLAHITNVAADLGADIVKTAVPRSIDRIADIVEACPAKVVFSGAAPGDHRGNIGELAAAVMAQGGAGLAVGRRVWTDPEPAQVVGALAAIVHAGGEPA